MFPFRGLPIYPFSLPHGSRGARWIAWLTFDSNCSYQKFIPKLIDDSTLLAHQVSVKIDKQGHKTLIAVIHQSSQQQDQESVVVKPDGTTMIDGQKLDCSQKACKSKLGGASVRKTQRADGKTQVELLTKVGSIPYQVMQVILADVSYFQK